MRAAHWFIAGMLAFLFSGLVSIQTALSSETQQALAPTGKLRVAFLSVPLYAIKDAASGELKGVAIDLGKELAHRLGVPFQPVIYPNPSAIILAAKAGEWDVALTGINAERAAAMDFSAPYMEVEHGYLVRADVPIATMSDVDKSGVRIAVLEKASAERYHSNTLKNATLIRVKNLGEFPALLISGTADVFAATKAFLSGLAAKHPGARVLDGRFLVEPIGMGVPKGRNPIAAAYVAKFVEEAKAAGLVKSAVERAGLRGVEVAPPK